MNLDGKWFSNTKEFELDVNKEYDWVYSVSNMGYTKFNKEEKVVEKLTNIEPQKAICDNKEITIIGTTQWLFEDFNRYIIIKDEVIYHGVHPSIITIK